MSGFFSVITLSKNDEEEVSNVFLVIILSNDFLLANQLYAARVLLAITLSNDFLLANLLHAANIMIPKTRVRRKIAGSLF